MEVDRCRGVASSCDAVGQAANAEPIEQHAAASRVTRTELRSLSTLAVRKGDESAAVVDSYVWRGRQRDDGTIRTPSGCQSLPSGSTSFPFGRSPNTASNATCGRMCALCLHRWSTPLKRLHEQQRSQRHSNGVPWSVAKQVHVRASRGLTPPGPKNSLTHPTGAPLCDPL